MKRNHWEGNIMSVYEEKYEYREMGENDNDINGKNKMTSRR